MGGFSWNACFVKARPKLVAVVREGAPFKTGGAFSKTQLLVASGPLTLVAA